MTPRESPRIMTTSVRRGIVTARSEFFSPLIGKPVETPLLLDQPGFRHLPQVSANLEEGLPEAFGDVLGREGLLSQIFQEKRGGNGQNAVRIDAGHEGLL
jgi:hypothetical protein